MSLTRLTLTAALAAITLPAFAADPELIVIDWVDFEKEPALIQSYIATHRRVPSYSIHPMFYDNDDVVVDKILAGIKADIVHTCSELIPRYRDYGLIEPWDISRIPEYASVGERIQQSDTWVDGGGVWFIPTEAEEGASGWVCGYVNMKDGPGSEDKVYDFLNARLAK